MISANQTVNEHKLVSDIIPIFNCVDPRLDDKTGCFLNTLNIINEGPRWILSKQDSEGIRHRIGITVPSILLNKLIRELMKSGYLTFVGSRIN